MLNLSLIQLAFPAVFALLLSLLIGYIISKVSLTKQLIDYASKRKLHQCPTPPWVGGVVIIAFSAVLLSILAYFNKQLLFYQIMIIELFLFSLIIIIPRLLKPRKQPQLN